MPERGKLTENEKTSLNDPVLALISNYFFSAKLMRDHAHTIREEVFDKKNTRLKRDFLVYYGYYLSALWVVVEGFCELNLKDNVIEELAKKHGDSLRLYRNGTFHYQRKPDKHVQFHGHPENRMNWVEKLYFELERFFCNYMDVDLPEDQWAIPKSIIVFLENYVATQETATK